MSILNGSIGDEGPVVAVLVTVHAARHRVLQRNGLAVPAPLLVPAQLDTGAFCTGFAPEVFTALGLDGAIDVQPVLTPSTADPHPAPVYVVGLTVPSPGGGPGLTFPTLRVLAYTFDTREEIRGLIGRDVLARCRLTYDGPAGAFTLEF